MFLVPSLTALLGHKAWWPGHGDASSGGQELPVDDREPVGAAAR
jgi:RND superfamily putative drug exporter